MHTFRVAGQELVFVALAKLNGTALQSSLHVHLFFSKKSAGAFARSSLLLETISEELYKGNSRRTHQLFGHCGLCGVKVGPGHWAVVVSAAAAAANESKNTSLIKYSLK